MLLGAHAEVKVGGECIIIWLATMSLLEISMCNTVSICYDVGHALYCNSWSMKAP